MSEFELVDPILKKFSTDYSVRLVLGARDYDLRILDFGDKGRIRIDEADERKMVKLGIMPKIKPGKEIWVPLEELYIALEKIKGDL
jgi:hypothetical protein